MSFSATSFSGFQRRVTAGVPGQVPDFDHEYFFTLSSVL